VPHSKLNINTAKCG